LDECDTGDGAVMDRMSDRRFGGMNGSVSLNELLKKKMMG